MGAKQLIDIWSKRKTPVEPWLAKQGIHEFHRKYVLVQADKAANNVVVLCRLHHTNTSKQELDGTRAYKETEND